MRNSYKNWIVLWRVEESERGFENLARNPDVKIQKIKTFLEIWGKKYMQAYKRIKLPIRMPWIWVHKIEKQLRVRKKTDIDFLYKII